MRPKGLISSTKYDGFLLPWTNKAEAVQEGGGLLRAAPRLHLTEPSVACYRRMQGYIFYI